MASIRVPIGLAAELALADPGAWMVAAAGFLARGGVLFFIVLLVQLPSPITVTLILGVDSVTGTGEPTPGLVTDLLTIGAVATAAVLLALSAAAWADVVAMRRTRAVVEPATTTDEARDGPGARLVETLGDVLGLAWLQGLGLLPPLLALAVAAPTVGQVAVTELLLPSSSSVPYVLRVLAGAQGPLLRAAVVLVVFEGLTTVASRHYLAEGSRRSVVRAVRATLATLARRPLSVATTWALGWSVLIAAVGVAIWGVSLAWGEVRAAFLDPALVLPASPAGCPATGCGDRLADAAATLNAYAPLAAVVGVVALFVAVWLTAVALIGLAGAFRSALWTLVVDLPAEPAGVRWPADAAV